MSKIGIIPDILQSESTESIQSMRLADLEAFVVIAESGTLTAAARQLGRSLQTVSRSLAALEADVGVELVHRTTRHSTMSEAGRAFYHRVKPAVTDIREAQGEVTGRRTEPKGTLRVGAPVLFGPDFLVPILGEYVARYPAMEVDLQLTDSFANLADDGLDVVIRIADLPDSGLQSRKLGALRRVVFGAPAYFEKYGRPQHPRELSRHSCIVRTIDQRVGHWAFQVAGKPRSVTVGGSFRANTMTAIYSAVRNGMGLGYSPLWQIRHLVETGEVEIVLEEFEPAPVPINVLWQESKLAPAKVRAFLDLLATRLNLSGL
jgi:DNA-binding transcriptional LysR family regulator